MKFKRKVGLAALAAAAAVAFTAGTAGAEIHTQVPGAGTAVPGDTIQVTLQLEGNCIFDDPNNPPQPGATFADVHVHNSSSQTVLTLEDVPVTNDNLITFSWDTDPSTPVGSYSWNMTSPNTGSVMRQITAPGGRTCTDGNNPFTTDIVLAVPSPLLPTEMLVGLGLASVAAGGAYIVHRQRRSGVATLA